MAVRKTLIPCQTVGYTYIMTYMVRKLLIPRNFGHQGCVWGWRVFLASRFFSTLRVMVVTQIFESLLVGSIESATDLYNCYIIILYLVLFKTSKYYPNITLIFILFKPSKCYTNVYGLASEHQFKIFHSKTIKGRKKIMQF